MYALVRIAKEFSSPEALREYLHEHPNADKSKHHVKEHGHDDHDEGHKEQPKKSLKDRLRALSEKAQSFVKNAPKEVSKFLTDDGHRRKVLTEASAALEKVPAKTIKNVVDTVKHEVHEFKEAGAGIKAVLSGKKMNDHQKKAFKTVAFHVGLTVAATALTASGGPLAGMAMFGKSMAKHIAMKAASNALGHLHVLEELGHVGHGIKHVLEKLAAEEPNSDEVLVQFVIALMAKELSKLEDGDVAGLVEKASEGGEKKEASAERNLALAVRVASRFAAADLSTPQKAAEHIERELKSMFPGQHVKVVGERGVGIEVAHLDEDAYAKEQLTKGYTSVGPNLMVKINLVPSMGSGKWADLNVKPANDNPELKDAGIQPIRKAGGLTPEKAVEIVLKWFKKNQSALKK